MKATWHIRDTQLVPTGTVVDIYIYIHTYICIHMYIYGPGTSKAHAPHPGRVSTRDWIGSAPSLRRSSNSLELGGRQLLSQPFRARLPRHCPAEAASREREREAEREGSSLKRESEPLLRRAVDSTRA